MSYLETEVSEHCVYLETPMHHDEDIMAAFSEGITMTDTSGCSCGHTGRSLGPDSRPASEKSCIRGRTCFKSKTGM